MNNFPSRSLKLLIFLFATTALQLHAQCPGEAINIDNGSFEGVPSKGIAPSGWVACQSGQSPDIQPGNFGVSLPASDGNTYAGLYYIDTIKHPNLGSWQEGLTQQLATPLKPGSVYHSSVDLSNSSTTDSGLEPGCASLEIWGGFSECDHAELLWTSGNISNYDAWQNYQISFLPAAAYTFITIQIKGLGCSGMPYILVDHFQPLVEEYHIQVEITADKNTVCPGTAVTLTATASNAAGTCSYTWNNGSGGSSTTVNPVMTSSYAVTVTDSTGCISEPASFTVHTLAPLKLSYKINPFCEGDSTWLTLFPKGGNGSYEIALNQYKIYGDSILILPVRDSVYTITLSDSCSTFTDTLEIKFLPAPQADFTWSKTGNAEYAFSDFSSISSGTIVEWNWLFGHGESTQIQNPVQLFTPGYHYSISLQVISDQGCKSNKVQKDLIVPMNVFPVIKGNTNDPTGITDPATDAKFLSGYTLYVFTETGNLLKQLDAINGNPVVILQSLSLPSGTYVYKTTNQENQVTGGKIVIMN